MIAGGMARGTEEDRIHMAFLLRDKSAVGCFALHHFG
jgi:hypothetical protein